MTSEIHRTALTPVSMTEMSDRHRTADAPPPGTPPSKQPARPRRRWLRCLMWTLLSIFGFLIIALAALWLWAGQPGSLATVLRIAGAHVPLVSENASGTLRQGGTIAKLVWGTEDGLRVEVDDAEVLWQPMALLHGQLQLDTLSARRIVVTDKRPPPEHPEPSSPPGNLSLPLAIEVKSIAANEFVWSGPPEIKAHDFRGHYRYNRIAHQLHIQQLALMDGAYKGDIALNTLGRQSLKLALQGVVAAPSPEDRWLPPLRAKADAEGPLENLAVNLQVQADPAAEAELPLPTQEKRRNRAPNALGTPQDAGPHPELHASARITPWQAPLLPELQARFQAWDASMFLPQAPKTGLSGELSIHPLPPDTPVDNMPDSGSEPAPPPVEQPSTSADPAGLPMHWRIQGHIRNSNAGPLDRQRLPLTALDIDADWRNGLAVVRELQAQLGGGTLRTQGQWRQPTATRTANEHKSSGSTHPYPPDINTTQDNTALQKTHDLGTWSLTASLRDINPNAIHTQLDSFPLDGKVTATGAGQQVDFDAKVTAQRQRRPLQGDGTLQALALEDLAAQGRWDGRELHIATLKLRASEAGLEGSGRFQPSAKGGSAKLALTLPGTRFTLDGALSEQAGAGQLNLAIRNLQQTHAWLKRLPNLPESVLKAQASGQSQLSASWRGGWQKPSVDAKLDVPQLRWLAPESEATLLGLTDFHAALQGGLQQASLQVSGVGAQGERRVNLNPLRLQATRTTPTRSLADSNWTLNLQALQASLHDPAMGTGNWQLALAQAVNAQWQAAQGRRAATLHVGAGQLTLRSPAPEHTARIEWDPVRWQGNQLSSAGRIVSLPFAWAEQVAGPALREAGIQGDMVFDGRWNLQTGQQLRVEAGLKRRSGDLTLLRQDPTTGIETRIQAGLRDIELNVRNQGEQLQADLRWDSSNLGQADGQVATRLTAARNADGSTGWSWPESAPLNGKINLQLPRINTWSVLAPPGWRLQGSLNAQMAISGTRSTPTLNGTLQADDLAMRSVVDGLSFQNGRLRARLAGQRLLLDEFSLQGFGPDGGRLLATGEAGLTGGKPSAAMRISLQKLRASIHSDRQVTLSGNLTAALQDMLARVNGQLQVDQALILLPESSAPSLGSDVVVRNAKGISRTRSDVPRDPLQQAAKEGKAKQQSEKAASSPLQVLADVKLNLGNNFRLRGMGINTLLKGDLNLVADGPATAMPRLTGDVRTVGGTFKAYGQNLNIQRGLIRFTGQIDNPTLDIRAVRPNYTSDQRVGVVVQGNALLPVISLYSNPALPDNEVLAWLLLGREAPESGAEAAMLQSAAMAVLGGTGESLASRLGLDELSFSTGDGSSDASVTLGKRLSDKMYASYERSISGVTGTLMIYLELSRRWTLRGQAGDDSAIDLLFRLSYD